MYFINYNLYNYITIIFHFFKDVDKEMIMACCQMTFSLKYVVERIEIWRELEINLDIRKSLRFLKSLSFVFEFNYENN